MNRPKHPLTVFLVTLAAIALIAVRQMLGIGCPINEHLGIPCLTCGMTRATLAALRLDFRAALLYHPLVFTLPLVYWTLATELEPFKSKRANKITVASLAATFLAVWVAKLITTLI